MDIFVPLEHTLIRKSKRKPGQVCNSDFDIGVNDERLSLWTLWWCHSRWRVDAHGWCTEGESRPIRSADVLAKFPAAREYSSWNIEQYSAQILINIRHIFWPQNVREIWKGAAWETHFLKNFFIWAVLTIVIIITTSSWGACVWGQRLERFGTFCPFHRFTALYRCSPQLLN